MTSQAQALEPLPGVRGLGRHGARYSRPTHTNRRIRHDQPRYKGGWLIEAAFCRVKEFLPRKVLSQN